MRTRSHTMANNNSGQGGGGGGGAGGGGTWEGDPSRRILVDAAPTDEDTLQLY